MVLRELLRRPVRALLSSLGIAFGIAIVVVGDFADKALEIIITLEFETARREDLSIGFTRPVPWAAASELAHAQGVLVAEPLRAVPVRLRVGHRSHDTALLGHPPNADLARVVEWPLRVVPVPEDGVLMSDALARKLHVGVGDLVSVEVLEGSRRTRAIHVSGLSREPFGMSLHMESPALHAWLGEEPVASAVLLSIDPRFAQELDAHLKRLPRVASVTRRGDVISRFRKQNAESMRVTSLVLTLFGCAIAASVVYNNARIALSVRSRDLASLRVLGFTRREISAVLFGELATYVLIAIPPGILLGKGLAAFMMASVNPEIYRLPVVVTGRTYAFAVAVTLVAALASALVVRRQLDRLDLVAVLKARE
jgi:putative ABC transport system permease protein